MSKKLILLISVLVLSLACTPIDTVFGFKKVLRVRGALGLYAFMYASLHLLTFVGWDYGFDLDLLGPAILDQRSIGLVVHALDDAAGVVRDERRGAQMVGQGKELLSVRPDRGDPGLADKNMLGHPGSGHFGDLADIKSSRTVMFFA